MRTTLDFDSSTYVALILYIRFKELFNIVDVFIVITKFMRKIVGISRYLFESIYVWLKNVKNVNCMNHLQLTLFKIELYLKAVL